VSELARLGVGKTQEFLVNQKLSAATQVDAKKSTLTEKDALTLLTDVDEIYAAMGKKVVSLNEHNTK
jgi:hypothetical protein